MSLAQDLNTLSPAVLRLESRAPATAKIAIIGADNNEWATRLFNALRQRPAGGECYFAELRRFGSDKDRNPVPAGLVYVPGFADRDGLTPDLLEAENLF